MSGKPAAPIHDLFNNRQLRSVFLKLRIPLALILFFLLLTRLEKEWFAAGLAVSALGELLQLWCFATIRTKKRLTTQGPYMLVRNPMYIGRFFLIAGILLMTGDLLLVAIFATIYYFYMVNRVQREETVLREIFGEPYVVYCRAVNRYIPKPGRVDAARLFRFDPVSFRENNGLRNLVLVGAAYVILFFFTFIRPLG